MIRHGAAAFLVISSIAAPLRADLADDVDKLVAAWSPHARVTVLPPRFPIPGETTMVALPPDAPGGGDGCTTLAVVGAVSTTFALRFSSMDPTVGMAESFLPSVAGAVHLVRCGGKRERLAVVGIQMRSPHGVIETVVATSERPLMELRTVLPHRDPGTLPSSPEAEPAPLPAALLSRVNAVERFFSKEGIGGVQRNLGPTDASGSGQVLLDLSPGCHHVFVLSVPPEGAAAAQDVDAEIAWANGTMGAADRTDSPDATLLACTGERRLGLLTYAGGSAKLPVLIMHGKTDLPAGLPPDIGPDARGRMAKVLVERHATLPKSQPVHMSLGVAGITELPIEVEPGRCYLALAAPIQGDTKLLSLNAEAGSKRSRAHSDDSDTALLASFCVGAVDRAKLEVEAHGFDVVWVSALWPTAKVRLGDEMP